MAGGSTIDQGAAARQAAIAAAKAAAKAAAERLAKQQAEEAAKAQQKQAEQNKQVEAPQATPEPAPTPTPTPTPTPQAQTPPEAPAAQPPAAVAPAEPVAITRDTFVADTQLATELNKSKSEMAALFDQAATLGGDAEHMSGPELEQLFLHVQTGAKLEQVTPQAAPETARTEQPATPEQTEADKAEAESPVGSAVDEATKVLGPKSPIIQRFADAKAAYQASQGDPKAAAEFAKAGAELLQELNEKGGDAKLGAKLTKAFAAVKGEMSEAGEAAKKFTALGKVAGKFGKVAGVFLAVANLADGMSGIAKAASPGDPMTMAKSSLDSLEAMTTLFGKGEKPGLLAELGADAKELGGKLAQGVESLAKTAGGTRMYEAAQKAWSQVVAKAGNLGEGADAFLGKMKDMIGKGLGKLGETLAKETGAMTEGAAAEYVAGKFATALGKIASCVERLNPVLTAIDITYQAFDFMMREVYMPAIEATRDILGNARHSGQDPNQLTAGFDSGADQMDNRVAALNDPKLQQQEGYKQMVDESTAAAEQFNRKVEGGLVTVDPYNPSRTFEHLRENVAADLKGQSVDVRQPDGKLAKADAGDLYQRLHSNTPPLTPAEHLALAGPLGHAAAQAMAMDTIKDGRSPTGLPPEKLTPAMADAMTATNLAPTQYVRSLSDAELQRLPADTQRHLLTSLAAQSSDPRDQVLGGDATPQASGRLLAAYAQNLAKPGSGLTPEAQAAKVQEVLNEQGYANRDNVVRYAVETAGRKGLDAMSTEVKQVMAAQLGTQVGDAGNASSADAECATTLAESIRRSDPVRGGAIADQMENAIGPALSDAVARAKTAAMTNEELDRLPLAEKQRLAAAMNETMDTVSEEDVKQITRLSESVRRNGDPAAADAMVQSLNYTHRDDATAERVKSTSVEDLAKLPKEELKAMIGEMDNWKTHTDDNEKAMIAKVALAMVQQAQEHPPEGQTPEAAGTAAYQEARGLLDAGFRDDVAVEIVKQLGEAGAEKRPPTSGLEGLPQGARQQLFNDLLTGYVSGADLEAATRLAKAMPETERAQANQVLDNQAAADDRALSQLQSLDEAEFKEATSGQKGLDLIEKLQSARLWTSGAKEEMTAKIAQRQLADIDASQATDAAKAEQKAALYEQVMQRTGSAGQDNVTDLLLADMDPSQVAALTPAMRQSMRDHISGSAGWLTEGADDHAGLAKLKAGEAIVTGNAEQATRDQAATVEATQHYDAFSKKDDAELGRWAKNNPEALEEKLLAIKRHLPPSAERDALVARMAKAMRTADDRDEASRAKVDERLRAEGI